MEKRRRPFWIPVVAGMLKKGDKVLLGLRPEGNNLAGFWEFPGGKMEAGESPEQSLKRELSEELGIEAEIGQVRVVTSHSYGETGILLMFYDVPFWKGEPKTVHHSGLKWVGLDELEHENLPEANLKILDRIKETLSEL